MKQVTSPKSEQHLQALAEHAEWEWMLGQVVKFRQQHGHEDLGSHPAGLWLAGVRAEAAAGKLSALKRQRLEEAGITLPKAEARRTKKVETVDLPKEEAGWEALYSRLDAWQAQHGHCEVPRAWAADPELARWVQDMKRLRAQRRLTRAQETRLEALGFIKKRKSAPKTELWEKRYAELVAYHKEHGHTNVKKAQNGVLKHWRDVQREFRRKGMLSADRIARLDEIGFEWEAPGKAGMDHEAWYEHRWETMLGELAAFKERWGHCHVPLKWREKTRLGHWVAAQRQLHRKGKLPAARETRLEALGFEWDHPEQFFKPPYNHEYKPREEFQSRWEEHYADLAAFKKEHGHTNVTEKMNKELGGWREMQRTLRKRGKLSADRIAKLEEIGFEWEAPGRAGLSLEDWQQELWKKYLNRVKAFRERFGHCHVPVKWREDPTLAHWVHGQRKRQRKGKLQPVLQTQLEALGFFQPNLEGPLIVLWEQRYAEMVAYQKEHGHTNVRKAQDPVLKHWRDVQREFRRKGMLRADRIARLDEIGFEWEAPGRAGMSQKTWEVKTWEARLDELKAFRERFGHCQVPMEWEENVSLAGWVGEQRKLDRQGRLNAERRAQLDALGFAWKSNYSLLLPPFKTARSKSRPLQDLWELRYAEMVAFQKEHGHTDVTKLQNRVLGRWRHAQREFYKAGKLSAERIARLEEIGFTWES